MGQLNLMNDNAKDTPWVQPKSTRLFNMSENGKACIRRAAKFNDMTPLEAGEIISAIEGCPVRRDLAVSPRAAEVPVHVYVIAEIQGGYVKVGVSHAPQRRMATLQNCNPRLLEVAYQSYGFSRSSAMEIERAAHRLLDDCSVGSEWFACSSPEAIAAVIESGGLS